MKTVTGTLITAREVESAERINGLRSLAWLMDSSIPLPGGFHSAWMPSSGWCRVSAMRSVP